EFEGTPLFWDRQIVAIAAAPSATEPGTYDIDVLGADMWRLPVDAVDGGMDVEMKVNGVSEGKERFDAIWHGLSLPPQDRGLSSCNGSPDVCDSENECGAFNLDPIQCDLWISYPSYAIACECGAPWTLTFVSVPARPGDVISASLVALDKSLPTLPGSDG